jgi:hypothetical protein
MHDLESRRDPRDGIEHRARAAVLGQRRGEANTTSGSMRGSWRPAMSSVALPSGAFTTVRSHTIDHIGRSTP